MFQKILIANRGEIACRIMDTCRRLGVRTVAVYSDADRHARHVRMADEAVHVGPAAPARSYLDTASLLEAARETGAEAIHPGYGFVSESPEFAEACEAAGIRFIGPDAATIRAIGSKSEAKRVMEEAGVPTVPGYHGEDQDDATLAAEAERIGYPLMLKAVAGGGGKGMRIVRDPAGFDEALAGARREARGAFGDDRMILERYLEHPRHIEMQVFGDRHGNVIHLFERECSIQRRYQKVIEESPSPFLDGDTRGRMGEAAVAAARAVDYVGAGTVEFIVDADGHFHFMEMNTRLQVEHPVTEAVTGQDLVEWQLRVAADEPLPLTQQQVTTRGHAIEARLYAENPEQGFVPSGGVIDALFLPAGDGIRIDSGVERGDAISLHYDPMVAKLIVSADDRPAAVTRLRGALAETGVFGPASNAGFLAAIAELPAFAEGRIDTGFIDTHLDALLPAEPPPDSAWTAAAAFFLERQAEEAAALAATEPDPGSPWYRRDAWQMAGQSHQVFYLADRLGDEYRVVARPHCRGWSVGLADAAPARVDDMRARGAWLDYRVDGRPARAAVLRHGRELVVTAEGIRSRLSLADGAHGTAPPDEEARLTAPMPGRIVKVHVADGDAVAADQPLLVLEAMKMEYTIRAPAEGRVERVHFAEGEVVDADETLVELYRDGDGGERDG